MHRFRRAYRLLLLAVAATVSAMVFAEERDYWQIRSAGSGPTRFVESTSVINRGRPPHPAPANTSQLHGREHGPVSLRLQADAATHARLQESGVDVSIELDRALEWLTRLTPARQTAARIELHLVSPRWQRQFRKRHPARPATVVELMVPLAATLEGPALSVGVGKALATALHELTHALDADTSRSRSEDEYRASLVSACYLLDTLRPGDVLHLSDAAAGAAGDSFITTHSREAASRVTSDLAAAAGTHRIAWQDRTAMMALDLFCGTRLADPEPSSR
ncbi:MAG: hypothetical protein Q4F49_06890 [Pseudoxanthomonas suwonensis]|nr:hypothetical protein [Pseudoxanthomonas suwonensis]